MNLKQDIRPLSDFKRNTSRIRDHLRRSRRPVVLTINGKAEMVVQDAEAYQRMLDLVERMEANEGIRKGLAAVEAGRSKPARAVISAIKERRAVRR
jgi:PHD/YefM family antitoxin component YafN of YafNO toxin-antitoxin module